MRNFDEEIQELIDEIKRLEIAKSERKDQLSHLLIEKKRKRKEERPGYRAR